MTQHNFQQIDKLTLADSDLIAKGGLRLVFKHPEQAGLLVKVIDPEAKKIRYGKDVAWYKLPRRSAHYACFYREVSEFIAVWAKAAQAPPFLQRVAGFADTQFGLGMVVEAALNQEGDYAPSLADLTRKGLLTTEIIEQLKLFWEQLLSSNVVVSDLHPGNLVHAFHPENGPHFTLIDGIGCSTLIPLDANVPFFNHRTKKRKFGRMLSNLHSITAQTKDNKTAALLKQIRI